MRKPSSGSGESNTTPCCSKVGIKRGPWTAEEDSVLADFVRKEGEGKWRTLPKRAGLLRCGKSCRLRWMNYLRPSVKRGHIAPDEEDLILRLHRLLGNRWSLIAGRIPGRTDNEIKNYWNTHLSKKLINQGIDPRTHKPFKTNIQQQENHHHHHLHRRNNNHHVINKPTISTSTTTSTHVSNEKEYHKSPLKTRQGTSNNEVDQLDLVANGKVMTNLHGNYESFSSYHSQGISESNINIDHHETNLVAENIDEQVDNNNHDDLNYCSDDMFSSFINSLINDDAFLSPPLIPNNHHNQHQHQQVSHQYGNNIVNVDSFLSPNASVATSNAWESAIISSSFDQVNHSQRDIDDPVD